MQTILEMELFEPLSNFSGSLAEGVHKIEVHGPFVERSDEVIRLVVEKAFVEQSLWDIVAAMPDWLNFQVVMNKACES